MTSDQRTTLFDRPVIYRGVLIEPTMTARKPSSVARAIRNELWARMMTDQFQPILFAPRDGTTFEARTRQGMIFSCRYDSKRASFVNTATNHRVDPRSWRPNQRPHDQRCSTCGGGPNGEWHTADCALRYPP